MTSQQVPPLRIQKGNAGVSPTKMPTATGRPLSELSPMAIRRNSPSFPQSKGKLVGGDSSPAGSSPFSVNHPSSPRLFWQGRDPNSPARENRSLYQSPAPTALTKRSSLENLKKASRVKNSSMFALEQNHNYDPSRPSILDGRPLSTYIQNTALGVSSPETGRKENVTGATTRPGPAQAKPKGHDSPVATQPVGPLAPSRMSASPAKSSLSKKTGASLRSGFYLETGIWEDEDDGGKALPEGRSLHRYGKSVTFDQAPPQVNEYEMTTPDPSSVASGSREGSYESMEDDEDMNFERGSSADHDDSFDASLEDTDKTPVVLPEDWRFMSPDRANIDLAKHEEDVFENDYGSPEPGAHPGTRAYRPHQTSANSVDSNGQSRPLPPLPSMMARKANSPAVRDSLSGTIERISSAQRSLPLPPQAATISKADIQKMSASSLSMEDRLRLMAIQEQERSKADAGQRERRMRRAGPKDGGPVRGLEDESVRNTANSPRSQAQEDEDDSGLSRDSLHHWRAQRNVNERDDDGDEYQAGAQFRVESPFDPDVPIPSLEDPTQSHDRSVAIKEEEVDDNDLYSIPDLYSRRADSESEAEDDLTSQYSQASFISAAGKKTSDEHQETPRAQSPARDPESKSPLHERVSLPEFTGFGNESSFNLGLEPFLTPPSEKEATGKLQPTVSSPEVQGLPNLAALRNSIQHSHASEPYSKPTLPSTWREFDREQTGTPDSVIRHPVTSSASPGLAESDQEDGEALTDSHAETEPSPTSSETGPDEMAQDSELDQKSPSPAGSLEADQDVVTSAADSGPPATTTKDWLDSTANSTSKRVSSLVQLEIPRDQMDESLELGLEKEFDRVVEAQKRGYLMRQNTKLVVASERESQEEGRSLPTAPEGCADGPGQQAEVEANQVLPSPRNVSQPTWTAEPWNGKTRRKSIRIGGEKSMTKRKPVEGPVPPLPGQASNAQEGLGAVAEDEFGEDEPEDWEDGAERGRLFVKVVGVKDLQLPLPQHERTYFALTLDNGLHCVTTAWMDLAHSAPIGQEFELIVLNELEFQLTLQMKLDEPKVERPPSPAKPTASPKRQGAFGRLFGSPKKKKESESRAQAEVQTPRRPLTPPSAYELVQGLVAKDGSFARAYVALNEHEKHAYGRTYSVDITCFNEWALEEVHMGSSRSKKSVTQLQRRPPYEIGKLELQLLYVPKPKGTKDEDMPKSMNGAIRALREAEERMQQHSNIKDFEGHLSQQGGDCPYWRRRFFKLVGTKLTAYHQTTLQPRATINLAKAIKLIDDKSQLAQKETSAKGGGRRKSAFAEEEEGYMFIEEGFRIRFANGEVIDFYADSTAEKDDWMKALGQVVGKGVHHSSSGPVKGWTEAVLKREKRMKAEAAAAPAHSKGSNREGHTSEKTSKHGPPQPISMSGNDIPLATRPSPLPRPNGGHLRTETYHPDGSRSQAGSPVKAKVSREERHRKTKSMYA